MEISEEWKADVRAKLEKLGMSQAELARSCGVTASAISVMLNEETRQTRIKPLVHRALNWADPEPQIEPVDKDAAFHRLLAVWRDLDEVAREHVIATGMLLRKPKR